MFCYYGFEACGDVAEETPDASRAIPKAMRMTIYIGGFAAMLVCLALVLAVPDLNAVLSGKDTDPVTTTLRAAVGEVGLRGVIAIVMVSFASCLISLEAATSRLLYSYGRDRMIFGGAHLSTLSKRTRVPVIALLVAGAVPALLGALIARAKGWKPSDEFRLGIWAWPVNLAALAYGVLAIINMVWPRTPQDPWYRNYGMIVGTVVVVATGLLYAVLFRPYDRIDAPEGDAHLAPVPGK